MESGAMQTDSPDGRNGNGSWTSENGVHLYPVSAYTSGEGLPYAPIDWPNPGDNWSWRVGKRVAASGYFLDRYLYLPVRFQGLRKKAGFASKLSAAQYIQTTFPGTDVDAFFASFSWKIPSDKLSEIKERLSVFKVPSGEIAENSDLGSDSGTARCKAGNRKCSSLVDVEAREPPSEAMFCDACCSEPGFCRDCCCILCCRTINSTYETHSVIRCKTMVVEGFVCYHVAHIECGLRSYMAGTVGGSIGLDAEYYCRRCDARTDLIPHFTELLKTCKSIEPRSDIQKLLDIGVRVLCGSGKTSAKRLLRQMEFAMEKLNSGTSLEEIWKMEDISADNRGGASHYGNDTVQASNCLEPLNCKIGSPQILSGNFDHRIESIKLEDDIDQILLALRKSQESEYNIAAERLYAQRDYLLNLYQQLDKERSELAKHTSSTNPDSLLDVLLNRVDQIKREIMKLRNMEEVAKGFGKTPKDILQEHFGFETES